jgi:CRP/FNR family transcriptional regulator, nitrogen oxide reductase regulator
LRIAAWYGRQMRLTTEHGTVRATAIQGDLFSGLPDGLATRLLSAATVRQSQKGSVLFHQGDEPDQLLQVVSGLVRMTQISTEGMQTTLRIMRSGDLLGCVAVLQRFPYPATATAIEEAIVLSWRSGQFLGLIKQHQAIMENTLQIVGARTRDMVQRVGDMSGKNVERRIASALLRLADQAGTKTEDGIHLQFPITRDDLAEMVGLTYFTVSRTLSLWQKQGLVSSGRQRMTVLALDRLAEIADGRP